MFNLLTAGYDKTMDRGLDVTEESHTLGRQAIDLSVVQLLGRFLSYPRWQTVRMNLNRLAWMNQDEGEIMARFGVAKLVKNLTGKTNLSAATRKIARRPRSGVRSCCIRQLFE